MDKKLKRKWLEALRSGKYKQGNTFLNRNNKFCCLGVLADIMGLTWKKHPLSGNFVDAKTVCCYKNARGNLSHSGSLDSAELQKAGFGSVIQDELIEMNDSRMLSFSKIAAWIEKNL